MLRTLFQNMISGLLVGLTLLVILVYMTVNKIKFPIIVQPTFSFVAVFSAFWVLYGIILGVTSIFLRGYDFIGGYFEYLIVLVISVFILYFAGFVIKDDSLLNLEILFLPIGLIAGLLFIIYRIVVVRFF